MQQRSNNNSSYVSNSTGNSKHPRRLEEGVVFQKPNTTFSQVVDESNSGSNKIILKRRLSIEDLDLRKLFASTSQAVVVDKSEDSSKITAPRRLSVQGIDFEKLNTSLAQLVEEPNVSESTGNNKILLRRRLSIEAMDFRKLNASFSHVIDEDGDVFSETEGLKPSGSSYQIPAADEKRLPAVVTSAVDDSDVIKPHAADIFNVSMTFKDMDFKSLNASLSRVNDAHHDISTERKLLIQVQEIDQSGTVTEKGFVIRDLYNYIVNLVSVNCLESGIHNAAGIDTDAHILRPVKAVARSSLELSKIQSKSSNNLQQSMLSNREQNWSAQRPQPTTQLMEKTKKHLSAGQPPLWDARKSVTSSHHSHPNGHHAQLPLRLRDLHRLDPYLVLQVDGNHERDEWDLSDDNVQFILVRRGCILFAYGQIRAVILPNMLIVLSRFDNKLTAHYRHRHRNILQRIITDDTAGQTPFEIRALEALLKELQGDLRKVSEKNQMELRELMLLLRYRSEWGGGWSLPPLSQMAHMKNQLNKLLGRVACSKELLAGPLEDDDLMALMNLTYLMQLSSPQRGSVGNARHDMVEELFESIYIEFNSIEITTKQMQSQLGNAEALVKLRLDTAENELLMLHSKVFIFMCFVNFGTYVTGLNAMNCFDPPVNSNGPYFYSNSTSSIDTEPPPIYWYTYPNGTSIVVACTTVVIFSGFFLLVKYFENIGIYPRKVSLKSKID